MIRRLRLGSGLILFAYLTTHLLNHALGILSLEALSAGREVFLLLWRNPVGSLLLYGALLVHLALAYWAIFKRRSLRMPPWEAAQLLLGLAIPPLLMIHLLGTRLASQVMGLEDNYVHVLLIYFVFDPVAGVKQATVLLVAWLHACIGLHFWLRLKSWYGDAQPYLFGAALIIPLTSLFGVWMAGRTVARLAGDPAWLASTLERLNALDSDERALILGLETGILAGLGVILFLVLGLRLLRAGLRRRMGIFEVTYPEGRRVRVASGTTILEASREGGIPHASVCGGRGRCSTCRVRLGRGGGELPLPSPEESRVLARVGAPPGVRLACQTPVLADCDVVPLLPSAAGPRDALARPGYLQGDEREIAILFADLRGFTAFSEKKLPYDVVFLLNRYFAAMGEAVEESGGRLDKFIGDGVMALFGIERGVAQGSRNALAAARAMAVRLEGLNRSLASDLDGPLRMGIGLHSGTAIVGEMGYGPATSVTAVGDAVNIASRLETLTKEFDAQLIVSAPLAEHAGIAMAEFERQEIAVRGRDGGLAIYVVKEMSQLPV
jgi:adenylate cyclase